MNSFESSCGFFVQDLVELDTEHGSVRLGPWQFVSLDWPRVYKDVEKCVFAFEIYLHIIRVHLMLVCA